MILPDQFQNNPLIQADMELRQQQPVEQQESMPSRDELTELGKTGKLLHMGGKLPEFLKGIVTEAKDMASKVIKGGENVIEFNREQEPEQPLDVDRAANALSGHESRGAEIPGETVATDTGATGISQITPVMINQYNQ